ncbi:sulfotransferase family 2 domain-containing protein [Shewanella donghaensis]|uniref:sulfotransferase family 2 domain-containing protein n=1 Tax=Shewanella donghaensis TaxID=238836 RepID=UPI0011837CA0|nr:sulfotransferase family 2 domain-containing protein [Shewanella donghaensis]
MLKSRPIVFSHIPKSAGTSFRTGLVSIFGMKNVLNDYTVSAKETSSSVLEYVYKKQDKFEFKKYLFNQDIDVLAGHFPVEKYIRIIPCVNFVTFLRDPVERVISEYKHFQRHKNLKCSLIEFASENRNINTQSRYLRSVPLASIGLVGITEQYELSIALFKSVFSIEIPQLSENIAPAKQLDRIDDNILDEIRALNQQDYILYQRAVKLLELRSSLARRGLEFSHGQFSINNNNKLQGWAFRSKTDKPLLLEIIDGNQVVVELVAKDFNVVMSSLGAPREGHVGFNYQLSSSSNAIKCRVVETQQYLELVEA